MEGQHARHGVAVPFAIAQGLTKQQQPSAFSYHRQARADRPGELLEAALALGQLASMQFGIAPGEQHPAAPLR